MAETGRGNGRRLILALGSPRPSFNQQLARTKAHVQAAFVALRQALDEALSSLPPPLRAFLFIPHELHCRTRQLARPIPRPPARSSLRRHNFAAVLPGDSLAELVVTKGLSNFFSLYNTLLVVRIICTWFPEAPRAIVNPISTICDPYLNLFRGIIPPLGGTLDFSPILAFLLLDAFSNAATALPAELPAAQTESAAWRQRVQKQRETHQRKSSNSA